MPFNALWFKSPRFFLLYIYIVTIYQITSIEKLIIHLITMVVGNYFTLLSATPNLTGVFI